MDDRARECLQDVLEVDGLVVWGIVENDLESLIEDAERLFGIS